MHCTLWVIEPSGEHRSKGGSITHNFHLGNRCLGFPIFQTWVFPFFFLCHTKLIQGSVTYPGPNPKGTIMGIRKIWHLLKTLDHHILGNCHNIEIYMGYESKQGPRIYACTKSSPCVPNPVRFGFSLKVLILPPLPSIPQALRLPCRTQGFCFHITLLGSSSKLCIFTLMCGCSPVIE